VEIKPFLPEHGKIFLEYQSHISSALELAHSGFAPHLIWSDLLEYRWAILEEMFCLFATSQGVTHLALAPFGKGAIVPAVEKVFEQISRINPPHIPSRIDNVDSATAVILRTAGFTVTPNRPDYLYIRNEIVRRTGNKFHAQRGAYNQAGRLHPVLRLFSYTDIINCLYLFDRWASIEQGYSSGDPMDKMMKEDARFSHHAVMKGYQELGLTGYVVEVQKSVVGYTFGFPVSQDIFCVLLEITDRSVRGLSAWLFCEFCRTLSPYKFINTMDDSGLSRLGQAKSLWHPVRTIPSYTVSK